MSNIINSIYNMYIALWQITIPIYTHREYDNLTTDGREHTEPAHKVHGGPTHEGFSGKPITSCIGAAGGNNTKHSNGLLLFSINPTVLTMSPNKNTISSCVNDGYSFSCLTVLLTCITLSPNSMFDMLCYHNNQINSQLSHVITCDMWHGVYLKSIYDTTHPW